MRLELHNVAIGQRIKDLSLTVDDGKMMGVSGLEGSGKTTLLRAILGFIPVDEGHISIDGELLTPLSAPYFRRYTAYVPQHLSLPDGYDKVPTDYLQLLKMAVLSGKPLLIADEPPGPVSVETQQEIDRLLAEAVERGMTVLAVNPQTTDNRILL